MTLVKNLISALNQDSIVVLIIAEAINLHNQHQDQLQEMKEKEEQENLEQLRQERRQAK